MTSTDPSVGAGSRSYRKSCCFGTSNSKVIVPEWLREESSTTALKAAAKIGGISYPHKGKGAMGRGIEDVGQKEAAPIPTISAGKRGRLQKAMV